MSGNRNSTRTANGESSVFHSQTDGLWHGFVTVGRKADGSIDRRHTRSRNEEVVRRKVRELERARDRGTVAKPGRAPTVEQWMTTYLATIAVHRLAPKSHQDYSSLVRNWITPALGKHRLDRLRPEHLDHLYGEMAAAGAAASSILKVHRVISRALKIARRREIVMRNVAEFVDPPSVDPTEQDSLSVDEARAVLAAAECQRNGVRWSIGLASGLRQGEALGLRWAYVNIDTGDVRVYWQLQRTTWKHGCEDPHTCGVRLHRAACAPGCTRHHEQCPKPCPPGCQRHASRCPQRTSGGLRFRKPKGTGRRVITLPAPLITALRRHKFDQDAERELAGELWEDHDLVFCQPNGRPIDPRRDWDEWRTLLDKAGVRHMRVHDGRHTAGTLLLEQGVHVRAVQQILGHSDVRTTQRYTHVADAVTRDAAQRIGAALWCE
ncbi:MAG: site-specific integrase [Actinobacteria bacterium]|nr:site-specific integrase [Actinomycetota bacterium]